MENHRVGCRSLLRDIYSGIADKGHDFVREYGLLIEFPIECLGCCMDYLMKERNYTEAAGPFDRVLFTDGNTATVSCFVKVLGEPGSSRGQLSTNKDINLGIPTTRLFHQFRTYQLYTPTAALSIGIEVKTRMESVAIENVGPSDLSSIYINYADGALVELYRAHCTKPLPSLRGICSLVRERSVNMAGLKLRTQEDSENVKRSDSMNIG